MSVLVDVIVRGWVSAEKWPDSLNEKATQALAALLDAGFVVVTRGFLIGASVGCGCVRGTDFPTITITFAEGEYEKRDLCAAELESIAQEPRA